MGGGGGAKVELNSKPKKIQIIGQFGALKNIHIKPKLSFSRSVY